ncbi:MAG: 1-phosphofructokinase family hexose kinase [Kiritimatiellia bacterium]
MFSVLCLSPAIDTTIALSKFPRPGDVIKGANEVFAIGGKGLNVARWLSLRGEQVRLSGILGQKDPEPFEEELERYNIEDRLIRVPGPTRINIMFCSPCGMFKMNRPAFPNLDASHLPPSIFSAAMTEDLPEKPSAAILSGSLPSAFPADFYASLARTLATRQIPIVLDTAGEALRMGARAPVSLLKPNRSECADLLGFNPQTEADFRHAINLLLEFAPYIILSDGAYGCWFAARGDARTPRCVHRLDSPLVPVADTTGAGDTLLAEFCYRFFSRHEGFTLETMKHAIAAGAQATTRTGALPPNLQEVEALYKTL